ncbi:MAG TPA: biotin--[acetyl-CoA-carboxylase] ligase [Abditibacteriaceae bacterium]|nr:biotin--[acetyl-CoA-carboxylase] ligase [Abditibacteriaceae bacterium]
MFGQPHRHLRTVASTNEVAHEWAHAGAPHGALVTAEQQTAGRGRRGRAWSSPAGEGLYLSLILRPAMTAPQVSRCTILASLATARAVEKQTGLGTHTKWPNDVLLHGRKIGGILSEAHSENGQVAFIVIGLGLNVNQESADLPPRPIFPASSLLLETGRAWPLETMRHAWLKEMHELWSTHAAGGWDSLRQEFQNRCEGLGRMVTVTTESATYQGVATGVDADGVLLVQTASEVRRVLAGDVSFSG